MKTKWVAFFSMSGSELSAIIRQLNRTPDLIITNRDSIEGIDGELLSSIDVDQKLVFIPDRPKVHEYFTALSDFSVIDTLVTLHGYLRILPPPVCDSYNIINGHPGLITTYPELKGQDPQRRSIKYPIIGTVLHHVTAKVDDGEIISSASCDNVYHNEVQITQQLKTMSVKLWVEHLRKQFSL